jgi:sulfopyruvate decarboxylase TPP-binding subunit
LEKVARATGIDRSYTVRDEHEFEGVLKHALQDDKPYVIVAKVDSSSPPTEPGLYGMTENAIRFRRALVEKGWVSPWHAGATMFKEMKFDFSGDTVSNEMSAELQRVYKRLEALIPEERPRLSLNYARIIYESLKAAGINMFVYLPDSATYLVQRLAAEDTTMLSVSVTREDEGMAIAMGGFLGGKNTCIVMEASGLGLSYLALAWLGIQQRMATLILASHTDGLGEFTDYHVCTRYVAEPLLRGMGIPHYTLMDVSQVPSMIKNASMTVRGHVFPIVLQLSRQVLWEDSN